MIDGSYENLLQFIDKKLYQQDQYGRLVPEAVSRLLDGDITDNYRTKTLICRLAAMLDDDFQTTDSKIKKQIKDRLFGDTFDVEHIQSYNDSNLQERQAILNEWKDQINSIGNLVALEMKINRAIGNKKYSLKRDAYRDSKYPSIPLILKQYPVWTKADCIRRQIAEKEKIMNYIFPEKTRTLQDQIV